MHSCQIARKTTQTNTSSIGCHKSGVSTLCQVCTVSPVLWPLGRRWHQTSLPKTQPNYSRASKWPSYLLPVYKSCKNTGHQQRVVEMNHTSSWLNRYSVERLLWSWLNRYGVEMLLCSWLNRYGVERLLCSWLNWYGVETLLCSWLCRYGVERLLCHGCTDMVFKR